MAMLGGTAADFSWGETTKVSYHLRKLFEDGFPKGIWGVPNFQTHLRFFMIIPYFGIQRKYGDTFGTIFPP